MLTSQPRKLTIINGDGGIRGSTVIMLITHICGFILPESKRSVQMLDCNLSVSLPSPFLPGLVFEDSDEGESSGRSWIVHCLHLVSIELFHHHPVTTFGFQTLNFVMDHKVITELLISKLSTLADLSSELHPVKI